MRGTKAWLAIAEGGKDEDSNSLRLEDSPVLDAKVLDEPVRDWASSESADEGANEGRDAADETDRRRGEVVGRGSEDLSC